jgi:transcriptional regulator with XRE-family HTH domain
MKDTDSVLKPRLRAQDALIRLRRELGMTQQDLAVKLGKAVVTVARWETSRSPSEEALLQLQTLASEAGLHEVAIEFKIALSEQLGTIGIPMTIEERTFHDALMDIMRNRQFATVERGANRIFDLLTSVHQDLIRQVKASPTDEHREFLDEIEHTFGSLEYMQAERKRRQTKDRRP